MKDWIQKYQAVPLGATFTFIFVQVLIQAELIHVNEDDQLFNLLGFLFYAVFISLAIYQYLKRDGTLLKVISGFVAFLIITFSIGFFTNQVQDNPLTILALISFWILLFYMIVPEFFKKYKVIILGLYGLAAVYFLYVRLLTGGFEEYESLYKNFALSLFLLPIPVVTLLWVYDQWKWVKTIKSEKAETELALLKSQVNPHFFFNTLNNLYSLSVNKSDKTPEMILKLSEMMRHTIYEGKKDQVPLNAEVEYLKRFIELHQIRYKKKVDITFNIPEVTDFMIAPLLFIILLENAFKHGIESLRENAVVHIELKTKGDNITFLVENNFEPKETSLEKGIGLENLKKRLNLLYPDKHQLSLEKDEDRFIAKLEIEMS